jgi:hypothetical protein
MRLFALSVVSLALALSFAQAAAADDLFPDKNLEAVVRQYVFEKKNKPDEPLVEADVVFLLLTLTPSARLQLPVFIKPSCVIRVKKLRSKYAAPTSTNYLKKIFASLIF